MQLLQLIYTSQPVFTLSPETVRHEIKAILDSSRRNNATKRISGCLLFSEKYFLQILEGDGGAVTDTFLRIARDPRHRSLVLNQAQPIADRAFGNWTMGFAGIDSLSKELCLRHSAHESLMPLEMTPEAMLHLAQDCLAAGTAR